MPSTQYGILHNRKTAGTALKDILEQQKSRTPATNFTSFEHAMTFPRFIAEHPDTQAIFFIRDPISRYVSGFYSRLREGKPRYYYPWSSAERRAFKRFKHPNQLAEALSSVNPIKRYLAISAMKSIGHVKHTYQSFLGSLAFLQEKSARIAFIGHQPEFDQDLIRLRSLLNIDEDIQSPNDEIRAHRNPNDIDKTLSTKATRNLQKWYSADYAIYRWCLSWRVSAAARRPSFPKC